MDYTEYCFKQGKLHTECIYEEDEIEESVEFSIKNKCSFKVEIQKVEINGPDCPNIPLVTLEPDECSEKISFDPTKCTVGEVQASAEDTTACKGYSIPTKVGTFEIIEVQPGSDPSPCKVMKQADGNGC